MHPDTFPGDLGAEMRTWATICATERWPEHLERELYPRVWARLIDDEDWTAFAAVDQLASALWLISGQLRRDERTRLPEVIALSVEPLEHDRPVTTDLLRLVRVGTIRDRVARQLRDHLHSADAIPAIASMMGDARVEGLRREVEQMASRRRRGGRRGLGDAHYRAVAEAYLAACRRGTRGIRKALATEFGRSEETIRDWIHRARELGYLPPGSPGRVLCEPGPRLLEELEDERRST